MKVETELSATRTHETQRSSYRLLTAALHYAQVLFLSAAILGLFNPTATVAQNSYTLFGDVKLDDSKADSPGPSSLIVVLYDQSTKVVGRQSVSRGGRYRFSNLRVGEYDLAIESDTDEIARVRLNLNGSAGQDIRQDFEFEWKPRFSGPKPLPGIISAADVYKRLPANKALFQKAQDAVEKKEYDNAVNFLNQILVNDKLDFQVWTLLGTVYLIGEKFAEAEKAYLSALEVRPTFSLALIKLGKLRISQKRFEAALPPLARAVELQPQSPDANLLLGETYLKLKKGSKAIPYLDEAARLGRIEAHLDLGWLYDAAGMKDKAAGEYQELLRKKPDYEDRKKLEQYISANKTLSPSDASCAGPDNSMGILVSLKRATVVPAAMREWAAARAFAEPTEATCLAINSSGLILSDNTGWANVCEKITDAENIVTKNNIDSELGFR